MQVQQATHEICLAEQLVVLLFAFIQSLDNRVGHIDSFISYHPERTYVFQTIVHHIGGCLIQRVSSVGGETDIICREL